MCVGYVCERETGRQGAMDAGNEEQPKSKHRPIKAEFGQFNFVSFFLNRLIDRSIDRSVGVWESRTAVVFGGPLFRVVTFARLFNILRAQPPHDASLSPYQHVTSDHNRPDTSITMQLEPQSNIGHRQCP